MANLVYSIASVGYLSTYWVPVSAPIPKDVIITPANIQALTLTSTGPITGFSFILYIGSSAAPYTGNNVVQVGINNGVFTEFTQWWPAGPPRDIPVAANTPSGVQLQTGMPIKAWNYNVVLTIPTTDLAVAAHNAMAMVLS